MNLKTIIKIANSALLLGFASTSIAVPSLKIGIDSAGYEDGSESGMLAGFDLHFDLYDTVIANGPRGGLGDLDEGIFAPFSHDARTRGECCTTTKVPEPGTLALFGLGLLGTGFSRRLRRFAR